MSVILRGIKMPITCGLCPCFHAEWPMYCQSVKADRNKRIVAPYGMPRPEWCPLVELPPHGRLIDGDIAEVITYTNEDGDFADGILYAADWIAAQPTIIKADKEGE